MDLLSSNSFLLLLSFLGLLVLVSTSDRRLRSESRRNDDDDTAVRTVRKNSSTGQRSTPVVDKKTKNKNKNDDDEEEHGNPVWNRSRYRDIVLPPSEPLVVRPSNVDIQKGMDSKYRSPFLYPDAAGDGKNDPYMNDKFTGRVVIRIQRPRSRPRTRSVDVPSSFIYLVKDVPKIYVEYDNGDIKKRRQLRSPVVSGE